MHEGNHSKKPRSLVTLQLGQKVGQLLDPPRDRIASFASNKLSDLAIALLNFNSIDDLSNWLEVNG